MRRLRVTLAVGLLALWLALVPSAHAIYGPAAGGFGADIVSVDNASDEQGNAATVDADISADGRYVVFQTRATNFFEDDGGVVGSHGIEPDVEPPGTLREGGIFRYDRSTGAIQLVADGSETYTEGPEKGTPIFRGAQNPSVSADGRFVAFSTAQQLVPRDHNENVDVYVRDMDVPLTTDRSESGAYTLVSAKDHGEEPATYAPRSPPLPGANPGADVWPNTAISAEGRYVVFRTTELASNLPDHTAVDTPPGQLFVRDLQAKTTTLLSRKMTTSGYPSGDPAGGATGPATISADGSTISWVATNAPAQTSFMSGESLDPSQEYYLWRRWQDAGAATRRITGIADLDDPACPPEGSITQNPIVTGPCYGPLTQSEASQAGIASAAPALSADGYMVAFLASSALRPDIAKPGSLDAFLTNMRPGISRKSGTSELTLAATGSGGRAQSSIESLALSADGSTIAVTTSRDSFVLPAPQPVGAFRPLPTASDLYVIHLSANTLERAVVSYEDNDPDGSISLNPTLTGDGATVAFTSAATNLIFGDANEASDAFTATLQTPAGTALSPGAINAPQNGFSLTATASPELGLSVKRGKDGGLILLVETPGAGKLTAQARGSIAAQSGKRARKKQVVLARASGSAHAEGITTLALHLAPKYGKDLERTSALKTIVTVVFMPPAPAEALSTEAIATFLAASGKKVVEGASKAKHETKKGRN